MNLNKQQLEATRLIFNGVMELQHIADKLGINVRTLLRWRETDEFKDEVESLRKDFRKATRNEFLAMQEARWREAVETHKNVWKLRVNQNDLSQRRHHDAGSEREIYLQHIAYIGTCVIYSINRN